MLPREPNPAIGKRKIAAAFRAETAIDRRDFGVTWNAAMDTGAAYLGVLGLRKLLDRDGDTALARPREPLRHAFLRGVIVNVLNPKTALFFLAFLPQFVDASRGSVWSQVIVFGLVFVGLGAITDSLYALAAGSVAGALRRRRTLLRYGSGTVFIGLGAVAAFAKRA